MQTSELALETEVTPWWNELTKYFLPVAFAKLENE